MNLCIIGTGYVGLVSAACFAETGNNVSCVDVNARIIEALNNGQVPIYEPGLEELVRRNHREGRLKFTTSLAEGLEGSTFAFITVGTPSMDDGSCNLCYVHGVASEIGRMMSDYLIVVDKSTVPVGTADQVRAIIRKELEIRGADVEYDVVSNPEFLKEGDAVSDFMKPDRVIVGVDGERPLEYLRTLYSPFARSREKLIAMSVRSAEMTKYAANCMLATKISFINEVANLCELAGADVRDVRMGIGSDSRIGYSFIYPGVGYGGSCFPKDVKALIHTARELGYTPQLLQAVDEVNDQQKVVLADKIKEYFKPQGGVQGRTLGLWGLAFKANTDDTREAAALRIVEELAGQGMRIRAYDPVAGPKLRSQMQDGSAPLSATAQEHLEIVEEQYQALDGADALAVVTEWHQFRTPNFDAIQEKLKAPVIFDGRNLYSPRLMGERGFAYFCIGRQPLLVGKESG
jgi:UDPglucose 6-dehydrogenase